MRQGVENLTEQRIDCGHWMAQEKPSELNALLEQWLAQQANYPAKI